MKYNTRILIVDDNKSIHEDFRKVLTMSRSRSQQEIDELEEELFGDDVCKNSMHADDLLQYEIDSAYQGQEALSMIQQAEDQGRPYALAFMDVRMPPGWDGVESISRIWLKHPYIEMVLCTAYSDYSWDDIVCKLGTTDKLLFLRKPFDAVAVQQMAMTLVKKWNLGDQARHYVDELEKEVRARTTQLESILVELEQKNEKLVTTNKMLKHVALHDSLTKLPNRELFHDRLTHAMKVSERENSHFAVVLIDVDEFKRVNDTYGHLAGDAVLYEVGERLSLVLRSSDTVSRLGGDEYALLVLNVSEGALLGLAKKILAAMEPPILYGSYSIDVRLSMGIAVYPEHGIIDDDLLSRADSAMYDAKSMDVGFAIYDEDKVAIRKDKEQLIVDLEKAIADDQLCLYYQPIYDLRTDCMVSVEALVRWQHPRRGLLQPDQFIYLAERKGIIKDLTLWVFNEAFQQCSKWHDMGIMLNVSINLSPRNFVDPLLPGEIECLLSKWGLEPRWVRLEITENMTLSQPEKSLEIISALEQMGLQISIDDFGTGYSSLSYLKRLPVSELKIDKSFVVEMNTDPDNAVIVKSTINLAKELGLNMVAEGVENAEVLEILKSMGCTRAQGFYICEPQPSEAFTDWLRESSYGIGDSMKAGGEK